MRHICCQCKKELDAESMVQFGGHWVCGTCKPLYTQMLREGVGNGGVGSAVARSRSMIVNRVISWINICSSVALLLLCGWGLIEVMLLKPPFIAIIGAAILLPTPLTFIVLEWQVAFRQSTAVLKPLGLISLALAAFVLFGYVSNMYEAIRSPDGLAGFIVVFSLICCPVAAYLACTGVYRLRKPRSERQYGPDERET